MTQSLDEMSFLESVIDTYATESLQEQLMRSLAVKTFVPYMRPGGTALEFGCSDGYMTSLIMPNVRELSVVDGSKTFIEMAKKRVPERVKFFHALFEDFKPDQTFDYIFASYVLEHVADAVELLKHAKSLLNPTGYLFIVVPNATALSRQIARHMGIVEDLYALTANDKNHGHRRVYDRKKLDIDIDKAGLVQVGQGGLLLKLLADFQMDKMIEAGILGEPQIDGLYKMGLEYPHFAGSLFSVCRA